MRTLAKISAPIAVLLFCFILIRFSTVARKGPSIRLTLINELTGEEVSSGEIQAAKVEVVSEVISSDPTREPRVLMVKAESDDNVFVLTGKPTRITVRSRQGKIFKDMRIDPIYQEWLREMTVHVNLSSRQK